MALSVPADPEVSGRIISTDQSSERAGSTPQLNACRACPTRVACTARDLDDRTLEEFGHCIEISPVLQRNDYLYRPGDPGNGCFVVRSGVFKSVTVTPSGEEYVTSFHYPGELLGLSGEATGVHDDCAQALTASTACAIPHSEFHQVFNIGAGDSLLRLLAERECNNRELENNLRQSRAEARIAGFLVLLMRRLERLGFASSTLPVPMSRTDLANHLGLTLECLSRVLGKWKRSGIVNPAKDHIEIIEPAMLLTLADHLS
jgi:CRP/FNR family transcriptional regulator